MFDKNYGNYLPDETDNPSIVNCAHCATELYTGDSAIEFDGYVYCSTECLLIEQGAREITIEGEWN